MSKQKIFWVKSKKQCKFETFPTTVLKESSINAETDFQRELFFRGYFYHLQTIDKYTYCT